MKPSLGLGFPLSLLSREAAVKNQFATTEDLNAFPSEMVTGLHSFDIRNQCPGQENPKYLQ